MATVYTWSVANLEYNNDADKGVTTVHWRVTGVSGDHSASSYGTTSHEPNSAADNWIAYDALTEDDVLAWVYASVDRDAIQAAIQDKLDAMANPTSLSGMPWAAE